MVAGGLDKISKEPQVLVDKVTLAFNKLNEKRGENRKLPTAKLAQTQQTELSELNKSAFSSRRFKLIKRASEQAHFVLAWPALSRHHPDRIALSVLSTILGDNMSSRLFNEVREKRGLCYYVHSTLEYYHDCGYLGAKAGVDPKRLKKQLRRRRPFFITWLMVRGSRRIRSD